MGEKMFKFVTKLKNKKRINKLNAFINKLEISFTFLQVIDLNYYKNEKIINALEKQETFENIVYRYKLYLQKINVHNETIHTLIISYNSILQNYPINFILDKIFDFDKKKLDELKNIIDRVYSYVIPNQFDFKDQYDKYKANLFDIISNYEMIKKQKLLILTLENYLENLPDCYIDNEQSSQIFIELQKYLDALHRFSKKYYSFPLLDKCIIDKHNEKFINYHLSDKLFDNINGKSLDNEQRRAILCDAKSNLTIAGAGSGKTLTICGKVKYLLENRMANKEEILLLSYSKASSEDLSIKISGIAENLTVETFHALGLKILTEASKKKKAIEEQLKSYITRFFEIELAKNSKIANDIFEYIALYFYTHPTYDNKYNNEGELFEKLKSLDYITLKDSLRKLTIDEKRYETVKKEYVKSNEELVIANFLFINGINYEYEKPYEIDTSTIDKRQYMPDFYLSDYGIYLEHYGIDREGNTPQYSKEVGEQYIASMNWKREIHRSNNTICIETYSYEFNEGKIFDNLKKRLLEKGVKFNPLSQIEVFNALHSVYNGRNFSSFFNLITTFISLYKSQEKDDSGFEMFKHQLMSTQYETNRAQLFLDICKDIYNYYIDDLRVLDKIDFDDMILQAIDLLDSSPNFKYKYIIVDEFQDISRSRTKFLQKLIQHGNSKLFAVGDDWQSIYRFAGCDINIFLDFDKIFPYAKLNFITTTHRNSSELQEIVEPFITANPNQYKKHIKSTKHQDRPIRIIYHKGNKSVAFSKALSDIELLNPNANILVLGRNKHDIDSYICHKIQVYDYKTIKHKDFPQLTLNYKTVHGSKGLENDFVILINGENAQNGFPNKIEDDKILNLLLGKKDNYRYAEERRLFYVALTRTKSIVYILSDKNKSSEFVEEIKNKCYIIEEQSGSEQKQDKEYSCPWCKSGRLIIRTTENNKRKFYGCSNYPYCKYTNNNINIVQYNNRCPKCGDFLVSKKGKYGTFIGCHNYPRCNHTQQRF